MLFIYIIKYPYLINLFIRAKITSCFYPVTKYFNFSNFIVKSYNITSYGRVANSTGYSFYVVYIYPFEPGSTRRL